MNVLAQCSAWRDLSPLSVHIGHLILDDYTSSLEPFPCLVPPDSSRVSAILKPLMTQYPDTVMSQQKPRTWALQFEFRCVL